MAMPPKSTMQVPVSSKIMKMKFMQNVNQNHITKSEEKEKKELDEVEFQDQPGNIGNKGGFFKISNRDDY